MSLPDYSTVFWVTAVLAVIFIGISKAGFGGGTAVNLIKLIPYSFLGFLRVGNVTTILVLSPLCYLGVRVEIYLSDRFTDKWFNRLICTLLFLTSIQLIQGWSLLDLFVRF